MENELFKQLEILEEWFEKDYITLKQYYEIKNKIVEKELRRSDKTLQNL